MEQYCGSFFVIKSYMFVFCPTSNNSSHRFGIYSFHIMHLFPLIIITIITIMEDLRQKVHMLYRVEVVARLFVC